MFFFIDTIGCCHWFRWFFARLTQDAFFIVFLFFFVVSNRCNSAIFWGKEKKCRHQQDYTNSLNFFLFALFFFLSFRMFELHANRGESVNKERVCVSHTCFIFVSNLNVDYGPKLLCFASLRSNRKCALGHTNDMNLFLFLSLFSIQNNWFDFAVHLILEFSLLEKRKQRNDAKSEKERFFIFCVCVLKKCHEKWKKVHTLYCSVTPARRYGFIGFAFCSLSIFSGAVRVTQLLSLNLCDSLRLLPYMVNT